MTDNIADLIRNRSDLSRFLVHFTREEGSISAEERLLNILSDQTLEAKTPHGMAAKLEPFLVGTELSQRSACFTETPIEHCRMLVHEIKGRAIKLSPYGVIFTKEFAAKRNCNPVWYLNMLYGASGDWLTNSVNKIVDDCNKKLLQTDEISLSVRFEFLKLTPFMEQVVDTNYSCKNFTWEREWRHVGDFHFRPKDVVAVFAPENRHEHLCHSIKTLPGYGKQKLPILDPKWDTTRVSDFSLGH